MDEPDRELIRQQLYEALVARAERLGLDPESIRAVGPSALTGRTPDGGLLRVDCATYTAQELDR